MNIANLELCKELYELSAWDDCWLCYVEDPASIVVVDRDYADAHDANKYAPAYELGFLLRKLPQFTDTKHRFTLQPAGVVGGKKYPYNAAWCASYDDTNRRSNIKEQYADTPEDALCKLAIELFKQGVLTREERGI